MEALPIPLFAPHYKNVEGELLTDKNIILYDGFFDEEGNINKRPGFDSFLDFTSNFAVPYQFGVDGNYWWQEQQLLISIIGGKVFKIVKNVDDTFTKTQITGSGSLLINNKVYFATDGTYVYMANGGEILYTDGTTLYKIRDTDSDVPSGVAQIAWIDGYLLAINGTNKFYYSAVNEPLSWTATDFATATGSSDIIKSILIKNREIYLLGQRTFEIWINDGENPFSRVQSGFYDNAGMVASDSIIATKTSLYWLDDKRHVVQFNGRSIEAIPSYYDKEIQRISQVQDCLADYLEILGRKFLIFNFKIAERTIVYDIELNQFYEWRTKTGEDEYKNLLFSHFVYIEEWNIIVAGHQRNEFLFSIDPLNILYTDDGTEDYPANEIKVVRRTGHLNFGTHNKKRGHKISLRLKRGQSESATSLILKINDDNKGFGNEVEVNLGEYGDLEIIRDIRQRGIFKTRQYEFYATDNTKISFGEAFQYLEVLPR